jgi:hypothetical protein
MRGWGEDDDEEGCTFVARLSVAFRPLALLEAAIFSQPNTEEVLQPILPPTFFSATSCGC